MHKVCDKFLHLITVDSTKHLKYWTRMSINVSIRDYMRKSDNDLFKEEKRHTQYASKSKSKFEFGSQL